MVKGSIPMSTPYGLKRRLVTVTVGVALTVTVSSTVSFANDMPVIDPGSAVATGVDISNHMNAVGHVAMPVDVQMPVSIDPQIHTPNIDVTHSLNVTPNIDLVPNIDVMPNIDVTHVINTVPNIDVVHSANVAPNIDLVPNIDMTHSVVTTPNVDITHAVNAIPSVEAAVNPIDHPHADHAVTEHTTGLVDGSATPAVEASAPVGDDHHHDGAGHTAHDAAQNSDAQASGATPTPNTTFDLGSAGHDFLASSLANFHSITIDVGGVKEVVDLNSRLTAAELVAAEQVLSGGVQTINLSHTGQALGGTVILDSGLLSAIDNSMGGTIGSLTVTQGVQLINTVELFNVSGVINNFGSILLASEIAGQTGTISASAIVNSFEALIGSYMSASFGGLYGADPILNALNSITNFGTISSAGNLTITAPEISNISTNGHVAEISAAQNLYFNTAHLVNSGNLLANNGDLNVTSGAGLLVENAGGSLQALNHDINMVGINSAVQVMGGNFDSEALNLKAGHSTINLQAGNVSGRINASADNVHLYTSESDLKLGNIDSSGDPTLASQGNILIDGTIAPTNGANLALVAGGNILSGAGGQLDTRVLAPGGGNGGNLSLIAGANFTVDGSGNVVLTDSANAGKGSLTGGFIDLTGANGGTGPINLITTAGTGATGNAGYVQMVSYTGTTANSGSIVLPSTVTIDASSAAGDRGNVSIISGGGNSNAIRTGSIVGNNIALALFTPTVGSGMFFDGAGTASNGINSFATTGTARMGNVVVVGNVNSTGDVSLTSGQEVAVFGSISANGAGGKAGGSLDGGNGHIVTLTAGNGVNVQNGISAVGGGGAGSGSATSGLSGGKGGNGGQVNITANLTGPNSVVITGDINVSGGGGGGGAGGSQSAAATAGGAGGTAGIIKITTLGGASVSGKIYEHDGGAGGAGANVVGGVGGGGGGGSSFGGGGGGGGGGTGNLASDFAAGGGGGFSALSGSGGGGGGVFGNASGGTLSFGGDGGSATGNGVGGGGDVSGAVGVGQVGGVGGGSSGGAGGTSLVVGGAGGGTNVAAQGIGASGGASRVVSGSGLLDVSTNGGFGSPANPIKVEISSLKLAVTGAAPNATGSAAILDTAGVPLNIVSANLGNTATLNITTSQNAGTTGADGTINVNGLVNAGTVNFVTNGDAGPNNININAKLGGPTVSGPFGQLFFSNANLTSNGGSITTFGPGNITATGGTLRATGDINITTNVGPLPGGNAPFSFGATSTNGNVLINQSTNQLNLAASGAAPGGSFVVNSQGPIVVNGAVTVDGGTINLNVLSGNSGIIVGNALSTGLTAGSITLTPSGTGTITGRANTPTAILTSKTINLLTNSSIGSAATPILTRAVNNGTINTSYSGTGSVYLSDSSTDEVTVNAPTASTGTLSVASQASQLNIPQADFSTVLINNNGLVGNVLLNSANNALAVLGNGAGAVTVAATGNIDANANNTGINGTSTSFTSTNGSIGSARRLQVSGATLTARAANGSVDVETAQATTVNASAGTSFNLIDTVAGAVTVNGPIAANNVNIEAVNATNVALNGSLGKATAAQVNVQSGGGIALNAGSSVTASDINLNSATNTVALGNGMTTDSLHLATNIGAVSIDTTATPGGTDSITAGGNLALLNNFVDTNSLTVAAGGDLTVGSPSNTAVNVSGDNVALSGQSVTNYGTVTGNNLTASGQQVTNNGTMNGVSAINATGAVANTGTIAAGDLAVAADTFTNSGAVTATSASVNAQGISNSGSVASGGALSLIAGGAAGITNTAGASLTGGATTLDSSAANGPISNAGTISGSGMQLLAGSGTITNSAGGNIASTDTLRLQASTINNLGSISAATQMAFEGPASGNLTVDGASGGFTTGNGASLTLQSGGDITVGGGANNPFSNLNQLGNFSVAAGGNFTSPLNSIVLVPDSSGNGGAININASNIVYNGSAVRTTPFLLSANGGTSAGNNGGSVNLNLFGSTAQGLTVGNSVGNFKISATGFNGGQVNLSTPGNLKVGTAQLLANATDSTGNGSSITLNGGQNVLLVGNLDTHTGTGSAGPVSITSGSTAAFTIDGTKTNTVNGQIGISNNQGISGNTVTINNAGGVLLANNFVLSGPDAININGSGLTNNGKVNTDNLNIVASGNGNLTTGGTGTYQNPPMQTLSLTSVNGNFNVSGNVPTANTVNISATNGTVAFAGSTGAINAAVDASGNGGTINIAAKTLTSSDLELNARGTTGSGGNVNINLTGTTALKVENGEVEIDVRNANGQAGGNVTISNGGNISIDARYLEMGSNFAAGQGANLSLTGAKVYMDHTNELPNTLHNLTLASNSSSAFNLGGASSSGNGIGDNNRTLRADNIIISNSNGAIVRGNNSSVAAGTVSLSASGDIGKSNTPLVVNTPVLAVNSTGGGAYINLRTAPNTDFVASVANTLKLDSTGSINTNDVVSAGALDLKASGINGGNLLSTTASTIAATTTLGDLRLTSLQAGPTSLGVLSAPGVIEVESQGTIQTSQAITSGTAVTLTSTASGIAIGNSITTPGTVALAAHAGNIYDVSGGTGGYKVAGQSVQLTTNGGNVGSADRAFRTSAQSLTVDTVSGGDVYLTNTNPSANGTVNLASVNSGSLHFNEANSANNNHGTLVVGTVHTNTGEIFISSKDQVLQVSPGASLTTDDGNITLQNTYNANGSNRPSIAIGDSVNIHGSSFGSLDTGNVYIVLGAVPTTANLRPGVAPTGGSPTINGTVYFGTNSNPNGSITTSEGVGLYGLDRNLVFNTGNQPSSQITVGSNTTIVADPPLAPGVTVADFGTMHYSPTGINASIAAAATAGANTSDTSTALPAITASSMPSASSPLNAGQTAAASGVRSLSEVASAALSTLPEAVGSALTRYLSAPNNNSLASLLSVSGINQIPQKSSVISGNVASSRTDTKLAGTVSNAVRHQVDTGAMLLAPERNTIIETPYGSVGIAAGSVALLIAFDKGLAVYDLHDNRKDSVVLTSGNHSTSLIPGRSAVLTHSSVKTFEDINPVRFVGYRRMSSRAVSEQTKLYQAEFEVLSMVRGLKPLSSLSSSTNPKTRKTVDNLLKTAAILLEMGRGGEHFSYYVPKEMMAYAGRKNH
ncbi:MAG: S-layer family protein [Candidatus Obscuribacterales bacterium]|jgi:hypothetical protein